MVAGARGLLLHHVLTIVKNIASDTAQRSTRASVPGLTIMVFKPSLSSVVLKNAMVGLKEWGRRRVKGGNGGWTSVYRRSSHSVIASMEYISGDNA